MEGISMARADGINVAGILGCLVEKGRGDGDGSRIS